MSNSRLIVKNLAKNVNEKQLSETFAKHGQVTDCRVMRDKKTKESRRFAFIGFKQASSAEAALKYMNKSFIGTCKISVEYAADLGEAPMRVIPQQYATRESTVTAVTSAVNLGLAAFVEAMSHKKGSKVWADDSKSASISQAVAEEEEDDDVNDIVISSSHHPHLTHTNAFDTGLDDLAYLKGHVIAGWDSDDEDTVGIPGTIQDSKSDVDSVIESRVAIDSDAKVREVDLSLQAAYSEGILDTGRIRVINLPYTTSKEALVAFCSQFGAVREVHICLDDDSKISKGFAFVTFVFPEHAVKAVNAASSRGLNFEGRIVRIEEARNLPSKVLELVAQKKSFKQRREEERRTNAEKQERTWNLLYVSANSAASSMANSLGVSKSAMMDLNGESDDLAVRVAIGETEVIRKTSEWLRAEGIRVNSFERKGDSLISAQLVEARRSKSTIIIKHLPVSEVDVNDLRQLFSKHGELLRFSISPSRTVAIAQFSDVSSATKCFSSLSFRRYRSVPLYLEWAPEDVFIASLTRNEVDHSTAEVGSEEAVANSVSLFVKNIDFSTTEQSLQRLFSQQQGFLRCNLMQKTTTDNQRNSMGYGFVEFIDSLSAFKTIKKLQGFMLDGKSLQLKHSESRSADKYQTQARLSSIDSSAVTSRATNRLCVRNVPFEANRAELKKLFDSYGNVVSVRMPLKTGESQHRGFAFIEFLSRTDAMRAMEALQHTHIYGRKMVIEPAEANSESVEAVRIRTAKRASLREGVSVTESKRRKITAEMD